MPFDKRGSNKRSGKTYGDHFTKRDWSREVLGLLTDKGSRESNSRLLIGLCKGREGRILDCVHPMGLSPGGLSPGGLSPGGLSPGRLSPGGLSPGRLSPGGFSPGRLSPGGLSPGGLYPGIVGRPLVGCPLVGY
jgi:hypothetical protein